jgi:hypothetical protein
MAFGRWLRPVLGLLWAVVLAAGGLALAGVLLMVGFGLLLTIGPEMYVYKVVPGPDRTVSLVVRDDIGGGPTSPAIGDVYIVGSSFERPTFVGRYFHGELTRVDGWRGPRTVNVCMLRYPFETPGDAEDVLVERPGVRGGIRVTKACPPEVLKAWNWRFP